MTTKDKILAIKKVLAIKFLGEKVPLVITWLITSRCNLRCRYCERWKRSGPELETSQLLEIIDQLKELGTIRISIAGGELLVRDDVGEIINYAKARAISVVLTSNGSLVPQKIREIKNLDLLKLSIEGKEDIHNGIRGQGSFQSVLEAARSARKNGLKFVFNSVLTTYNLNQVDFLLNLAKEYRTGVRFTALNTAHAGRARIAPLYPTPEEYRKTIEKLIQAKKRGQPVLNSFAGLDYLYSWPKAKKMECFAGRAFAHLSAEGNLFPCVIMEGKTEPKSVSREGLSKAFADLPEPKCSGCWCGGTLEFNLLMNLNLNAIKNVTQLI